MDEHFYTAGLLLTIPVGIRLVFCLAYHYALVDFYGSFETLEDLRNSIEHRRKIRFQERIEKIRNEGDLTTVKESIGESSHYPTRIGGMDSASRIRKISRNNELSSSSDEKKNDKKKKRKESRLDHDLPQLANVSDGDIDTDGHGHKEEESQAHSFDLGKKKQLSKE